jgi:hypothetical protein
MLLELTVAIADDDRRRSVEPAAAANGPTSGFSIVPAISGLLNGDKAVVVVTVRRCHRRRRPEPTEEVRRSACWRFVGDGLDVVPMVSRRVAWNVLMSIEPLLFLRHNIQDNDTQRNGT